MATKEIQAPVEREAILVDEWAVFDCTACNKPIKIQQGDVVYDIICPHCEVEFRAPRKTRLGKRELPAPGQKARRIKLKLSIKAQDEEDSSSILPPAREQASKIEFADLSAQRNESARDEPLPVKGIGKSEPKKEKSEDAQPLPIKNSSDLAQRQIEKVAQNPLNPIDPVEHPIVEKEERGKYKRVKVRTRQKRHTEAQEKRRFYLLSGLLALAVTLACIGGLYWFVTRGEKILSQMDSQESSGGSLQGTVEAKPKQLMAKFLEAQSVDEMGETIRRPDSLKPHLETYYAANPIKEWEVSEIVVPVIGEILPRNYVAGKVILFDQTSVPFYLQKTRTHGYRLDWESFVGFSDQTWERLQEGRPVQTNKIRAFATGADLYTGPFAARSNYFCVRLTDITKKNNLYGYISSNNNNYTRLKELVSRRSGIKVILSIRYPSTPENGHQVEIVELLREGWLEP